MKPFLSLLPDGVRITLYVQPKASKNQVIGPHGDALKVRIKAPPVDGAANRECVKFIAKIAGCAKSRVQVVKGQSSRTKQLHLHPPDGIAPSVYAEKIAEIVEKIVNH